jgi:hypothetical protein
MVIDIMFRISRKGLPDPILFHFELSAPVELHETGYYAGFGEEQHGVRVCEVSEPAFP